MLQGVNALYTNNDWDLVVPYIYTNNQWVRAQPKGYTNNEWLTLGAAGTLMVKFITSDGQEFYTNDGKLFLVREDPVLTEVVLTHGPNKTEYLLDDVFDPAGIILTGVYSFKGRTYYGPITEFTYDKSPLQLGTTSITLNSFGYNIVITGLTVINTFDSITIISNPYKTLYANGSSFNTNGLSIDAIYKYNGEIIKTVRITSGFSYPSTVTSSNAGNFPISYTFGGVTKTANLSLSVRQVNEVFNYNYTNSVRTLILIPGTYRLECWGAQGGYRSDASKGGKGGYAKGDITITSQTTIYIYTGGAGNTGGTKGGYNGGGSRGTYSGGGGGADIRIGNDSLYARVIVAGGGGSDGQATKQGGYGGGTAGETRSESYGTGGAGGTQTAAGSTGNAGSFGQGGIGGASNGGYGGAGGGGWYGGSGIICDARTDDERGGGGGSGYVYTSSTAGNYPSGCLLNSSHYLTNTSLIAGNSSFTDYNGNTVTGHSGDGACRITTLSLVI